MREHPLDDLQRLAGLGGWVWEVTTDTVTWTDPLYEIFGLAPRAFHATIAGYLERVHPDDRERVRGEVEGALQRGGPFEFEERIVRPDGVVRLLRSRGRADQDAAGRTLRLTSACLDITELHEAQERAVQLASEQTARAAAEATTASLRFLLDASRVLASSMDYEGTLRNVAAMAVAQIADWCVVDLVEPDHDLRRVAVAHRDPERLALARAYTERYPPSAGAGSGVAQVIRSGIPEHHPDVPDELLERTITNPEQRELLRELGMCSAVTVPLTGRGGVLGALTLVQAESGRRITGHDARVVEELGRHAALAIESARLHRELEEHDVRLEAQALELEQHAEELQTRAHHLEELMTELEATNHELRTPLKAIFGYADLLALGLHGPVTPEKRESRERIKRNQRTQDALVNDVSNVARPEAGKLELSIDDVPVDDVVAGLEKVVGPRLRAKGLGYRWRAGGAGVRVRGERERIDQILLNLLTNAIRFTNAGGDVSLAIEADEQVVRLRVRGTGCGIAPGKLESIFDPSVQIDRRPGAASDTGVGWGLAISRDLAQAMGGTLSAESRAGAGAGAVFTLALPRAG